MFYYFIYTNEHELVVCRKIRLQPNRMPSTMYSRIHKQATPFCTNMNANHTCMCVAGRVYCFFGCIHKWSNYILLIFRNWMIELFWRMRIYYYYYRCQVFFHWLNAVVGKRARDTLDGREKCRENKEKSQNEENRTVGTLNWIHKLRRNINFTNQKSHKTKQK